MTVNIEVDGRHLQVEAGTSVLQACLDNGIFVPNLCHVPGLAVPRASCRLCFVEIDGVDPPVASCTVPAAEAMVIRTDTEAVRRLQRTGLRLLLSVHDVDCKNCPANKRCALQNMARFLGVGLKTQGARPLSQGAEPSTGATPGSITTPTAACSAGNAFTRAGRPAGGPASPSPGGASIRSSASTAHRRQAESPCPDCGACVAACPVGALVEKPHVSPP